MPPTTRIEGDVFVNGNLSSKSMSVPNGNTITNAMIAALAGISASKLQGSRRAFHAQPNTTATTETCAFHVVVGATGTVMDFRAGSIAIAAAAATVTIDLKKNGTSILTSVITLNSANTARVAVAGSLGAGASVVAGDELEIVITATAGGGTLQTGVFVQGLIYEDAP